MRFSHDKTHTITVFELMSERAPTSGFIQVSLSKIQGLFKDFSRLFYSFQGLKVQEKY